MSINVFADVLYSKDDAYDDSSIAHGVAVSGSDEGSVSMYMGEMEQLYVMETVQAVERDDDGNPVYEQVYEDGQPVYDEDGNPVMQTVPLWWDEEGTDPVMETVPVLDENGDPVPQLDEDGNSIYEPVQLLDGDDEPLVVFDEDGKPVPQLDEQGNIIYVLDDEDNPVPMVDEDGDYIYVQAVDSEGNPVYDQDGEPVMEIAYQYVPVLEDNIGEMDCIGSVDEGDTPVISMGFGQPVIAPEGWGDQLAEDAEITAQIADEAAEVANATNQHFWTDDNGAHVTDTEQDDWATEYAKPNHGELSNPTDAHPWHNQLINSLGTLLRTGLVNLVSITRSAIAFFDGGGNTSDHVAASFGVDGARIGHVGRARVAITDTSIAFVNGKDVMFNVQGYPTGAAPKVYRSFGSGSLGGSSGYAYIGYDVAYQHEHGSGCEDIYESPGEPEQVYVEALLEEPEPKLWLYDWGEDIWFDADDLEDHAELAEVVTYSRQALSDQVHLVDGKNAYRIYYDLGYSQSGHSLQWVMQSTYADLEPRMTLSDVFEVNSEGDLTATGDIIGRSDIVDGAGTHLTGHNHDSDYAPISHNHAAGDITSGTLDAARIPTLATSKISGLGTIVEKAASYSSRASGTNINLSSISLTAGTWMVVACFGFASNSSGVRVGKISTTSADSSTLTEGQATLAAPNGGASRFTVSRILVLSATTTVYAVGYQSSGSSINGGAQMRAVRIK